MQLSIPADKARHYTAGSIAYLVAVHLLRLAPLLGLQLDTEERRALALLAPALLGWWKERRDAAANRAAAQRGEPPPHRVEFADAFATWLGGATCWASGA